VTRRREAITPPETIADLLGAAGADLVLVGGQALAFWAIRFGIAPPPTRTAAISHDVDFLAPSAADVASVERLAASIGANAFYPHQRALTSLVGQAIRDLPDDEYINVDVIFKIVGIEAGAVRKRAVPVTDAVTKVEFRVMHPLDVLGSRLLNLHKLAEKQNDKGRMQLGLAIQVAREFLRREGKELPPKEMASGRSPIQDYVSFIEKLAKDDAGRKVADRHGLHVADAIDPRPIPYGPFWSKRWPALQKLMSEAYRAGIEAPRPKRSKGAPQ